MTRITTLRPNNVGRLNEREILRVIQRHPAITRADLVRLTGLSAPTVSKAVAALLEVGLLEEIDADPSQRGRPARKVRLASSQTQVLGVLIDASICEVHAAGLDGSLHDRVHCVPTPGSYSELLDRLEEACQTAMARAGITTLGLGMSLPGLTDDREGRGVLSPNLPLTNGRRPAADLAYKLGIPAVLVQESHALCLAERHYGAAQGEEDFAVLDIGTGVGLGVMMGGRLLTGANGLAGEIGHITIVPENGHLCGCGNYGCLETECNDTALLRRLHDRTGRRFTMEEALNAMQSQRDAFPQIRHELVQYLAIAVSTAVNLFNPARLFVHSRLLKRDPTLFEEIKLTASRRALRPSYDKCRIDLADGTKQQGAVAAIVQHLTNAVAEV